MEEENKNQVKEEVKEENILEDKDGLSIDGIDEGIIASDEELETGIRKFKVPYKGETLELRVRRPTNQESEKGDWAFSQFFNKAITEGIFPERKMIKVLHDSGTWTEDDNKEIIKIQSKVNELVLALEQTHESRDYEELQRIKKQLSEKRNELFEKKHQRSSYLSHTAESKADDHRTKVLTSLVTEYAAGNKIGQKFFNSVDDMFDFENQEIVGTCLVNFMTLMNGLAANFLENAFPESKKYEWEKEVEREREEKKSTKKSKKTAK